MQKTFDDKIFPKSVNTKMCVYTTHLGNQFFFQFSQEPYCTFIEKKIVTALATLHQMHLSHNTDV